MGVRLQPDTHLFYIKDNAAVWPYVYMAEVKPPIALLYRVLPAKLAHRRPRSSLLRTTYLAENDSANRSNPSSSPMTGSQFSSFRVLR